MSTWTQTVSGTAVADGFDSAVVNLRAYFNDRNGGSSTQPGSPDRAGSVILNSLADDADSWAPNMTTAGATDGITEGACWYDPIDDVFAGAATDWTVAIDLQIEKVTDTTNRWYGAVLMGTPATSGHAGAVGKYYDTGSSQGKTTVHDGTTYTNGGGAATTAIVRGLLVPWPGSSTNSAGVAIALGRYSDGKAMAAAVVTKVLIGDTTGETPQVGVLFGNVAGTLTNGTGDVKLLAHGVDTARSSDDGGEGWVDLPFPGGAPDVDPDGLYVSDGGAHATDWTPTFDGNHSNSVQGHTPASGTARMRYQVDTPDGIDLTLPIEVEIVRGAGQSTTGSIVVALILSADGDGSGNGLGLNDASSTNRRPFVWSKSATTTAAASVNGADRARGVIALNRGESGTHYHGAAAGQVGTSTGPSNTANAFANGGVSSTAISGNLRLEVVIHNLSSVASNLTVNSQFRLRNLAIDTTTRLVAA